MGLDNCLVINTQDPFHEAKRVLGIWYSQESPPARVRPLDFIGWCRTRGFDTSWLGSIEEDAFNREREDIKAALGSGVVVIPSAPLLSAEWLASHIAFSLVAIPDDERLTGVFKETVIKQEPGLTHSTHEALTSTDWRLVRSICGNPPVRCSRAQFDEWRGKFQAAENRPALLLRGEFSESAKMTKAQARWCDVSIAHKEQIAQSVSHGGLSLVTADGIKTAETTKGFIRREDVKRYLDRCNLPWRDAQGKAENTDRSFIANGQPEFLEQGVTPDARELSTIGLTHEQWDRMTSAQRQSALLAIADTKAYSEQVARQSDERRALGLCTLNEAAKAISATGERFEALLEKLCGAAQRGDLPTYAPGERARYEYTNGKQVRPFYEEAYGTDLNTWLAEHETRIAYKYKFPPQQGDFTAGNRGADADVSAEKATGNATTRHSTKLRRNILDDAIDAAIAKAGSDRTPGVFVALRELALDGHAPFTGHIEGNALYYTNDNNEPTKLTKGALDAKLRRRREALLNVANRR